jgi:hypothetical protein
MEGLRASCWDSVRPVLRTGVDQPGELRFASFECYPDADRPAVVEPIIDGLVALRGENRLPRASAPEQPSRGRVTPPTCRRTAALVRPHHGDDRRRASGRST